MRWTAGRRAARIKNKRAGRVTASRWTEGPRRERKRTGYRVRQSLFAAASSSLVGLSLFCVQRLTVRSYSHWDSDLILAKTGQKSSYGEENEENQKSEIYLIKINFRRI